MSDEKRGRTLVAGVALLALTAAGGCGGDDDTETTAAQTETTAAQTGTEATEDADAGADTGTDTDTDASAGTGEMTTEALCDPVEPVAAAWIGEGISSQHFDEFADDSEFPALICEWSEDVDYREVRIVYHGSSDVWDATLAREGESLEGVDADNVYDGEILAAHAGNGWTVDINVFEGETPERVDDTDLLTDLANAALAATG